MNISRQHTTDNDVKKYCVFQIMNILRQRTTDNDVKKYCVEVLEKLGSFEYTRKSLVEMEAR